MKIAETRTSFDIGRSCVLENWLENFDEIVAAVWPIVPRGGD